MSEDDPFSFDISVSSAKRNARRTRRGMSGAVETSQRVCEKPGCKEAGKYRAPRSPDSLDDYVWFCQIHVREYNRNWSFFETSSSSGAEEKEQMTRDERAQSILNRQTEEQRAWARLGIDDAHQVLGANATQNPGKSITGTRRLPPSERRALEILEAKDHWKRAEIRKAYKELIKILHPDMNRGDRSAEDRLQEVVWAWDQIKASPSFRE